MFIFSEVIHLIKSLEFLNIYYKKKTNESQDFYFFLVCVISFNNTDLIFFHPQIYKHIHHTCNIFLDFFLTRDIFNKNKN